MSLVPTEIKFVNYLASYVISEYILAPNFLT